jgi:cell division protein FtsL
MGVSYRMMPSNLPGLFKGMMNLGPMMLLGKMLNNAVGGPWIRYKTRLMDRRMERAVKKHSKNDTNSGNSIKTSAPKREAVTA